MKQWILILAFCSLTLHAILLALINHQASLLFVGGLEASKLTALVLFNVKRVLKEKKACLQDCNYQTTVNKPAFAHVSEHSEIW